MNLKCLVEIRSALGLNEILSLTAIQCAVLNSFAACGDQHILNKGGTWFRVILLERNIISVAYYVGDDTCSYAVESVRIDLTKISDKDVSTFGAWFLNMERDLANRVETWRKLEEILSGMRKRILE